MNSVDSAVQPTGATHQVEVDRLFFSTTDSRSIITQANSVFVNMARRSRSDMVGTPHNIIRHPDMPGGAFRLVWDALQAGQPTCAYVKNLAGDGSPYWAFATLMPIRDGYLSVRSLPCDTEVLAVVETLYTEVREQELALLARGATGSEAADLGAELLEKGLREQGFADFAAFSTHLLPVEVAARDKVIQDLPARRASNPTVADLLSNGERILTTLRRTNASLGGFQQNADVLAQRLEEATGAMTALRDAVDGAGRTAQALGDRATVLSNSVPAVHAQTERVATSLSSAEEHVLAVVDERSHLLFRTALAQLQAETVARYAIELVDGEEDMAHAAEAVAALTEALQRGLGNLTGDLERNVSRAGTMTTEITDASSGVERSAAVVGNWRGIIERKELTAQFSEHLPALDSALAAAQDSITELDQAAQQFSSTAVGFQGAVLTADLGQLLRTARTM